MPESYIDFKMNPMTWTCMIRIWTCTTDIGNLGLKIITIILKKVLRTKSTLKKIREEYEHTSIISTAFLIPTRRGRRCVPLQNIIIQLADLNIQFKLKNLKLNNQTWYVRKTQHGCLIKWCKEGRNLSLSYSCLQLASKTSDQQNVDLKECF